MALDLETINRVLEMCQPETWVIEGPDDDGFVILWGEKSLFGSRSARYKTLDEACQVLAIHGHPTKQ
jgi:hypothetical protein